MSESTPLSELADLAPGLEHEQAGDAEVSLLPDYAIKATGVGTEHSDSPLFYLDGATDGTTQWKAHTLQVVNWGGFEGAVKVPFHAGATLLSGASGSGKSTLLDAYIALMMPSDTAFNGASNDAVSGRARSAGQRNLLSYLRGQTDTVPDASGRERPKLLRGDGQPTWGAIAMTFADDRDQRFTVLRVYYVPARATVFADILSRFATCEGELDLADLAPLAAEQFQPRALKAAFPGLMTHEGYQAFATRLHTRLGIGANGDGSKALKLLARIQAGQQIRTVDELYKDMVLERPRTYQAADRAIAHFDDLDAAYQLMLAEQERADLLAPITGKYAELQRAQGVIEQIDTFGIAQSAGNPVQLWSRQRELNLLATAVATTQAQRMGLAEQVREAATASARLEQEQAQAQAEHRDSGGADLSRFAAQLEEASAARQARVTRRDDLAEATDVLNLTLDDAAAYATARDVAVAYLQTAQNKASSLLEEREALRDRAYPLQQRRSQVQADRRSLEGRPSRITGRLHDLRAQVAQAAGMRPEDLPFLAELIDVREGEQEWRTAIETVLAGAARTLLVPANRLAAFSAAIDPLRLAGRLTFEGVPLDLEPVSAFSPGTVASKLVFKDSPFAGWVTRHLGESAGNAVCVPDAAGLAGPGYRVTLAGQTRRGSRGSHGRSEVASVIGFSSVEALADLDAELAQLEAELTEIDAERARIDAARGQLDAQRRAHEAVLSATWADIDVASADAQIEQLSAARDAILNASDQLTALQEHLSRLTTGLEQARDAHFGARQQLRELETRWAGLVDRQDEAGRALEALQAQGIELTQEQSAALDAYFDQAVGPGDPDDLADFEQNLARLNRLLGTEVEAARASAASAQADLEALFSAYLRRFPDPNLGRSVASYSDFAAILEQIRSTGLHQQRQTWRRELLKWSGEDLVPLAGAMESCVQEIEDRLEPINDILCHLPFGATGDRLRIRLRRVTPDSVNDFRRTLKELAAGETRELTEEQLQARFGQLQDFMARIRSRADERFDHARSDRDQLLDVRRHVFVSAERYAPDGEVLSTHTSLGDKSGGETQELVAFIVGAALRFRLGDDLRARPRFAPVVIDEGFIKSDSEFAGRAVQAWKGLGFQLIVGAPPDKVSALEPHMDAMVVVTKNTTSHYSFVATMSDPARLN